jgi:hypothetical protein
MRANGDTQGTTDKYRVPKAGMLTGLLLWIVPFIWYVAANPSASWVVHLVSALGIIAGCLIAFSGFA